MITDIKIIKQEIKDRITWETNFRNPTGGQSCGMRSPSVTLVSEDMDKKITIGYLRSQLSNKLLAFTLFELALDELIK